MNSLYVLRTSTRALRAAAPPARAGALPARTGAPPTGPSPLAFAPTAARSAGRSPRALVLLLAGVFPGFAVFAAFPARAAAGRSGIEVRGEPGPAALPPETGLPVAAERAGRVEPVVGVGPDHPGAQLPRHPQDPAALLGPDPRGQPVGGVVRLRHRLVRGAEREHRQDRPEDLFPGDLVGLAHAGEHRRGEPVALGREPARRRPPLRALGLACRDQALDLVELLPRVDRADVGVLVQRVAEAERGQAPLEPLEHGV